MSNPKQKRKPATISGGKVLAIIGVLWVAAVVGIYIVVVQLKLGGESGIRLPDAESEPQNDASSDPG
jgi:hypothetical protein